MRTDFAHLLHLFRLLSQNHEPTARSFPFLRDIPFAGRRRMALQPSLLLVESDRARADAGSGNFRRNRRSDCAAGS